jgi:phosphate transport system substrate-binding protein
MNMNGLYKKIRAVVCCGLCCLLLNGCSSGNKEPDNRETARRGRLTISADESFKAIIDSQLAVFLSEYPDISVKVQYKPEAECFKDFEGDSTRLIVVTRPPNRKDEDYYQKKFTYGISYEKVANDAVAVILNNAAKDTLLTVADLREILLGKSAKFKLTPVFDGLKVTSNLRFVQDSILKTDSLPATITGRENSQAVIDYVAKNKNSIGFVGVSWVGDSASPDQEAFTKKVKIAPIKCENCNLAVYKKPWQANIAFKTYPLVRGLYYIVKNDRGGVATNFAKWMEQERGQLIFKRAYLVPTQMNLFVEDASVER